MESINNLFSVINTEDATLIYGGSEFSNWVCEMFGKLCHGLTQENGADVCGRVFYNKKMSVFYKDALISLKIAL
jgi:hypothetical protein